MAFYDLTPPTDSLYKFVAISGLLVAAYSAATITFFDHQVEVQESRTFADANRFIGQEKAMSVERSHLQKSPLDGNGQTQLAAEQDQANAMAKKLGDEQGYLTDAVNFCLLVKNVCGVFVVVGFVAASIGGYFWYWKVQSLEDELLRLQVDQARAELHQFSPPSVRPSSENRHGVDYLRRHVRL